MNQFQKTNKINADQMYRVRHKNCTIFMMEIKQCLLLGRVGKKSVNCFDFLILFSLLVKAERQYTKPILSLHSFCICKICYVASRKQRHPVKIPLPFEMHLEKLLFEQKKHVTVAMSTFQNLNVLR